MKYSLKFLAWCNRCLYKGGFLKELEELGVPYDTRTNFIFSEIWQKHPCVLGIYQNFIKHQECLDALDKWLQMMQEKWDKYEKSKNVG